jgi:hypothetical protein
MLYHLLYPLAGKFTVIERELRSRPAWRSQSGPHPSCAGPGLASSLAPLANREPSRGSGFAAVP